MIESDVVNTEKCMRLTREALPWQRSEITEHSERRAERGHPRAVSDRHHQWPCHAIRSVR